VPGHARNKDLPGEVGRVWSEITAGKTKNRKLNDPKTRGKKAKKKIQIWVFEGRPGTKHLSPSDAEGLRKNRFT